MPRPMTPRDLLSLQLAGEPQLSPDGRRLAFVVLRIDPPKNEYRRQIDLMDAVPGAVPAPFTAGPTSDEHPRWSPDGRWLAFVSDRSGKRQVWVIDTCGGEARQVTAFKEGVTGVPVWSPDSRRIAFTAHVGNGGPGREGDTDDESDLFRKYTKGVRRISRLWYKADGDGFLDHEKPLQIFLVDAQAEPPEPVQVTRGPWHHDEPAFSPDGKALAFTALRRDDFDYTPLHRDIWVQELERLKAGPVCLTPGTFCLFSPAFSPDGSSIAFCGHEWLPHRGYASTRVWLVGRDGSGLRRVDTHWDRTFRAAALSDAPAPGGASLRWTPDGTALIGLISDAGRQQVAAVDVDSGTVTVLTDGDHCVTSFSYDARCRKLAVGLTRPDMPGDLFLVEGPDLLRLTHLNEALLSGVELGAVEHFTFETAPGSSAEKGLGGPAETDGWVIKPVGFDASRRYPAVLEVHGGPMSMYGWTFFMEFQCLAAAGYAVIYTNPRGSQGYSQDFCASIAGDWGNLDYLDVMAGLDAALARFPWLDGDRLGIAGGSYGGYMTNWAIGHTDRFKAAVTMRSVANEASSVGTSDFGFIDLEGYPSRPWHETEFYRRMSPITYVENIRTPLLIEHQEDDLRCPIEQAEQLFTALKVLRRTVEFVRYSDSSHGMSRTGKPWLRVHRLLSILDWFQRFLPATAQDPTADMAK